MQIQTITSKYISEPVTGYPVSFTQKSLSELKSLGLDELAATYENIPRYPGQVRDQLKEEQLILRSFAETPEKALEVAKDHCGRFGRDFRVMPLKEAAPLLNDYDHKFTRDDILTIAKSEGKNVQRLGETITQRFELWEVEGIEGLFVSGGGATGYLSTLSPHQTIAEIDRLERELVKANRNVNDGFQETVNVLVSVDHEAQRRQERAAQIEAGFIRQGDSYQLDDGKVEGFFANITSRDGVFDVKVRKDEYGYVVNSDMGAFYGKEVYVERSENLELNTRELTVDGVRNSLLKYDITLPPALAKELSDRRQEYWQGHAGKIDKISAELDRVLTQIIYNDMSAGDAEERRVGTAELAKETLSRPDLAGIVPDDKMRVMVLALRDIAGADQTKEPHVIAGEALAAVGEMSTPGRVERAVLSPDDRFLTFDAYGGAVEQMEAAGIAGMQRKIDARETSLRTALEDIRRLGGNRTDEQVFADTVVLARLTLSEHERDLRFFGQTKDVQVMHLALRTIAISDELSTYAASSSNVNTKAVDSGVQAFKSGVEFLTKLEEQGMSVGGESIDAIAKVVYQSGRNGASTYAQLGERMSAIAGAAINEVNSIHHSVNQGVSLGPQKINEVAQGKQGVGVAL